MSLDGRVWALRVGDLVYQADMRATARYAPGVPVEMQITVYLPNPTLVEQVRSRERIVTVLAGYSGDSGAVEIGSGIPVRGSIEHDTTSVDEPLTVTLSGRAALRVLLLASWETVTARDVLAWAAREAGLVLVDQSPADLRYVRGYYVEGPIESVAADVAADLGCEWEIRGSTLAVWPSATGRPTTAQRWSADAGLMRVSPASWGGRIRATAALYPAMRRGEIVSIVSDQIAGDYRVDSVTHEIDTQGDTWQTTIEGVPRG